MAKEHYSEEGGWSIPDKRKLRIIVEGLEECRKGKILDVGCGVGNYTAKLRELGFNVEGQEPDLVKIEIARKLHPGIKFAQQMDYEKWAAKEKYNAIISIDVIEHVKDYDSWLQSAGSSLKQKGKLVISTPNIFGIMNYLHLIKGDASVFGISNDPETKDHVRFFSKKTLREVLEKNGFKVVEMRTFSQHKSIFGRIAELLNKAGQIVAVAEKS